MEVQLENTSTFADNSSDLSLEYALSLQQKLEECILYIERIKQCLAYLTQEETDLNNMMLEGELEQNPDLIKFLSQTVSTQICEKISRIDAHNYLPLKVIKCTKLREVLKEAEQEIQELRASLILVLEQGDYATSSDSTEY